MPVRLRGDFVYNGNLQGNLPPIGQARRLGTEDIPLDVAFEMLWVLGFEIDPIGRVMPLTHLIHNRGNSGHLPHLDPPPRW